MDSLNYFKINDKKLFKDVVTKPMLSEARGKDYCWEDEGGEWCIAW